MFPFRSDSWIASELGGKRFLTSCICTAEPARSCSGQEPDRSFVPAKEGRMAHRSAWAMKSTHDSQDQPRVNFLYMGCSSLCAKKVSRIDLFGQRAMRADPPGRCGKKSATQNTIALILTSRVSSLPPQLSMDLVGVRLRLRILLLPLGMGSIAHFWLCTPGRLTMKAQRAQRGLRPGVADGDSLGSPSFLSFVASW